MHRIHLSALAVCAAFMAACATAEAGIGYSAPVTGETEDYDSWNFDARFASGGPIRFGAAMRTKLSDAFDQIAFAPEVTAELTAGKVMLGIRGGVSVLQFDNVEDEWDISLGSPYLSPVLELRTSDRAYLFVSGLVEYVVHFDEDQENQWFLGAQLGIGFNL